MREPRVSEGTLLGSVKILRCGQSAGKARTMESSETYTWTKRRINNTELAYIAGLLDGDGHFCPMYSIYNGKEYPCIRVAITNIRKDLLEWLAARFGGTIQLKSANPLSKLPCYEWRPKTTKDFLKLLKPYVRIKRRQLEVSLAFYSLPYGSTEKKTRLAEKVRRYNRTPLEDKVQAA